MTGTTGEETEAFGRLPQEAKPSNRITKLKHKKILISRRKISMCSNSMNRGRKSTGRDICGRGRRYLRTRTEISRDKSGDIRPQSRAMDRQTKRTWVIVLPTDNQLKMKNHPRFHRLRYEKGMNQPKDNPQKMHFSCVFAFLLTSDAIPFYLCGFFVLLKPFQAGKIRWHTTFVKTLKNFSHNTTQFLEKHFTVLTEIVQCFLEDVEENVIRWLSGCCIKKDSYKNKFCNELSLRNGISCQE